MCVHYGVVPHLHRVSLTQSNSLAIQWFQHLGGVTPLWTPLHTGSLSGAQRYSKGHTIRATRF